MTPEQIRILAADLTECQVKLNAAHRTVGNMAAEIARLREALQDVVDEYPVAAGTARLMGIEEEAGYGSIRRARAALEEPR